MQAQQPGYPPEPRERRREHRSAGHIPTYCEERDGSSAAGNRSLPYVLWHDATAPQALEGEC